MKKLLAVTILTLLAISACKDNKSSDEQSRKELELREKELDLKQKELELRERELDKQNSEKADGNMSSSGDEFSYPDLSSVRLSNADLENRDPWELRIMRNEIFARHGYIFKLPELRDYFMRQSWYVPRSEDVTNSLSPVEKENIELIKRYEEYIGSKYRNFAR